MNFLEKLNQLMNENGLNKNKLSKACGIPYTTIDGWYKKGYEGLKLTTLKRLSDYFNVSLDFWITETKKASEPEISDQVKSDVDLLCKLDSEDRAEIRGTMKQMLKAEKYNRPQAKNA